MAQSAALVSSVRGRDQLLQVSAREVHCDPKDHSTSMAVFSSPAHTAMRVGYLKCFSPNSRASLSFEPRTLDKVMQ